ncbi:MAG: phage virion morphogenesis protein [Blastocatellia bacterium]
MDIQGLEKLLNRLSEIALDASRRTEKPLRAAGTYMLGSIEKNFQQQGRPKKWDPLSPRTIAGRRKGRRKKGGPKILIDTARLKNSMSVKLVAGPGVAVGTNVVYAPRHHFGYDAGAKKGRGQAKTKSRPFVMFQDEDFDAIGRIFQRHIARQ